MPCKPPKKKFLFSNMNTHSSENSNFEKEDFNGWIKSREPKIIILIFLRMLGLGRV